VRFPRFANPCTPAKRRIQPQITQISQITERFWTDPSRDLFGKMPRRETVLPPLEFVLVVVVLDCFLSFG
jgi:hypothetical protein